MEVVRGDTDDRGWGIGGLGDWGFGRIGLMAGLLVVLTIIGSGCGGKRTHRGEPTRVVTLTPSATELVVAVGGLDKLVGVDRYSIYPEEVKRLPRVGDFMHPSFEAIITLRPHLVILDEVQSNLVPKLERAGVRTLTLRMHTVDHVRQGLREVGAALHRTDQADKVVAELSRQVRAIREGVAARAQPRPKVLMIIGREVGALKTMVAAGPGSYLDELLSHLHATNALASSPVRYPKISAEQVMQSRPDVILDAVRPHQVETARADWARLARVPAVKNGRIYPLSDQLFMSPGPRVAEALRRLAALLYSR